MDKLNEQVVVSLSSVLADSYFIFLKTQNYHWNVTGPNFQNLHTMFETQYNELFLAIDEIAERIRVLGKKAPGSFKEFSGLTSIDESKEATNAEQMLSQITGDHQKIIKTIQASLRAAQEVGDEGTIALLGERLVSHEKIVWMLASSI